MIFREMSDMSDISGYAMIYRIISPNMRICVLYQLGVLPHFLNICPHLDGRRVRFVGYAGGLGGFALVRGVFMYIYAVICINIHR
jgi:hypothetical protein